MKSVFRYQDLELYFLRIKYLSIMFSKENTFSPKRRVLKSCAVIISRALHWKDTLKNPEHLFLAVFSLCHVVHTPPNNYEDSSKCLFFFISHVYMDQSIISMISCMREFLKVHTISYFSSPKSEFWNCSFIDRWAAITVIDNSRKHQMLWSTYQQVKGGTLKHSAYWKKAFRGCREPL